MSEYKELRKLKYSLGKEVLEKEYIKRYEGYGTYITNLDIEFLNREGIVDYKNKKKLFVVNHNKLHLLQIKARNNSKIIDNNIKYLKGYITTKLKENMIIEDIFSTNDIEGVKSERKEIAEGYIKKDSRFYSMVSLYKGILGKEFNEISNLSDFCDIYYKIMEKELKEEDKIDGDMFRKEPIYIRDRYNKNIHIGVNREEKIKEKLEKLIGFLNDENIPILIRIIVGHYYFEYIHPFYDGNGRMGRYIMCMYLSEELDEFTSISLSTMLNKNRGKYYDGFKTVSEKENMGECTFFVQNILEIIIEGQNEFIDQIKELKYKLSKIWKFISQEIENSNITKEEADMLLGFIQVYILDGIEKEITLKELEKNFELSEYKCKKYIESLTKSGYIERIGIRPGTYRLKSGFEYIWE